MEKKKLTAEQKQKRYRTLQYTCVGGEFVSVLTPYIIMGIANADEWFVNSSEGWKIGLGGSLAMAILGIAVFLTTKKKDDETKFSNGWITLLVFWFAIAFCFMLLANIIDQISTIMLFGGIGLAGAFGLDLTSKQMKKRADLYRDAIGEVKHDKLKEKIEKEVAAERQAVE